MVISWNASAESQAKNGFRHTLGHFGVEVALRDRHVRESIDSASCPVEFALAMEPKKIFPVTPMASMSRASRFRVGGHIASFSLVALV